jgi:hypothetical protein
MHAGGGEQHRIAGRWDEGTAGDRLVAALAALGAISRCQSGPVCRWAGRAKNPITASDVAVMSSSTPKPPLVP